MKDRIGDGTPAGAAQDAVNDPALVADLRRLLRETYALWEPGWVNFNWRGYTYDHVQRVRGLALTLGAREGADLRVIELAALLHDVTKAYDGEYVLDADGKRAVDAYGYWRNATRPPLGANEVTAIYDRLGLAGRLHNESGALVAREVLAARGVAGEMIERVAVTIEDHLRPSPEVPMESRCLYDADTIDANIGLPAFVRNIYIHLHYRDVRKPADEPDTDTLLRDRPLDYLAPYVRQRLPDWSLGKRRDFIPKLLTTSAVALSEARLERLETFWEHLSREVDDYDSNSRHGCLAAVLHLMRHRDEPSIDAEAAYLAAGWLQGDGRSPEARSFALNLLREVQGAE